MWPSFLHGKVWGQLVSFLDNIHNIPANLQHRSCQFSIIWEEKHPSVSLKCFNIALVCITFQVFQDSEGEL